MLLCKSDEKLKLDKKKNDGGAKIKAFFLIHKQRMKKQRQHLYNIMETRCILNWESVFCFSVSRKLHAFWWWHETPESWFWFEVRTHLYIWKAFLVFPKHTWGWPPTFQNISRSRKYIFESIIRFLWPWSRQSELGLIRVKTSTVRVQFVFLVKVCKVSSNVFRFHPSVWWFDPSAVFDNFSSSSTKKRSKKQITSQPNVILLRLWLSVFIAVYPQKKNQLAAQSVCQTVLTRSEVLVLSEFGVI